MIQVETEIDIAAPPERVWEVLTDFAAFPGWNPMLPEVRGTPAADPRDPVFFHADWDIDACCDSSTSREMSIANGVWMLVAPEGWFHGIPAAVPDTGPFNAHLVRDYGVAFSVAGLGFAWCAANLERCYPVHLGLALFFTGHAGVHLGDLLGGRLPATHWVLDLPSVFAPALLLAVLALPAVWRRVNPHPASPAA